MSKQLLSGLLASTVAFGGIALASQPSQAQSTQFYCGVTQGVPTTIASTPRGQVPVIRWVSSYFSGSGYDPQTRCQEVSGRFQTYYNNNNLNYITTGIMNGLPVVCVTGSNGGSCSGLLFTLKKGQSASKTIQQLFDVRAGASGPLYESSTGGSGNIYIDVNNYLDTAPVAESADSSEPNPVQPETGNTGGSGGSVW